MNQSELVFGIVQPHFDAVRDEFVSFVPEDGHGGLTKLAKVRCKVDAGMHDTERHYAAMRDDGLLMVLAPEIVELPWETIVAIVSHEFGHAADFAYPGQWLTFGGGPEKATWLGEREAGDKAARKWRLLWEERMRLAGGGAMNPAAEHARDQIEWAADGIVEAVTGHRLGYCGRCMIQCFNEESKLRPAGLR